MLGSDKLNLNDYLNNLWRWKCGLPEKETHPDIDKQDGEWSDMFIRYMKNRMKMGGLRYGSIFDKKSTKKYIYAMRIKLLKLYDDINTLEDLVDLANFAMCVFIIEYKNSGFISSDDKEHL